MDLKEYFISKSRELSVKLKTYSPSIKKLTSGKGKNKTVAGVLASFTFNKFKMDISYTERSRNSFSQQYIWVSFVLDAEPTLPFSLYDILAFTEPENFNCYTYTFVDSNLLMKGCFDELEDLLKRIIPILCELLENGVTKNNLIASQKESINKYFGDNVLENSEALGARADTLINMMLNNFYRAQIESAIIGAQAVFFKGKNEKALKLLKKAKSRSLYQENLLKHLENGGKAPEMSEIVKKASQDEGAVRHNGGSKGALKMIGYTTLFAIPVSLGLCLCYFLFSLFIFRDSLFILGLTENVIFVPFTGILLSMGLALKKMWKNETEPPKDENDVQTPKSRTTDVFLKYFIIIGETVAFLGLITSIYSITSFHKESFSYGDGDFPIKQIVCEYESIDYIAIVDGYLLSRDSDKFLEEKHIAVKTKSGSVIDIYSCYNSTDKILQNKKFFEENGIEIKNYKIVEEME